LSSQWANIGEDAGAVHALVARVADHVPVELIDQLWVFPPRRTAAGESTVVVIGAFEEGERRRVATARFIVSRNRKGEPSVSVRFDEHGAAPTDAIPRIVQGVLRRMGEDTGAEPREVSVGGRTQRWDEFIVELGGRPPAAAPEGDAAQPATADATSMAAPQPAHPPEAPTDSGTIDAQPADGETTDSRATDSEATDSETTDRVVREGS
jgi:hypothetical protein